MSAVVEYTIPSCVLSVFIRVHSWPKFVQNQPPQVLSQTRWWVRSPSAIRSSRAIRGKHDSASTPQDRLPLSSPRPSPSLGIVTGNGTPLCNTTCFKNSRIASVVERPILENTRAAHSAAGDRCGRESSGFYGLPWRTPSLFGVSQLRPAFSTDPRPSGADAVRMEVSAPSRSRFGAQPSSAWRR